MGKIFPDKTVKWGTKRVKDWRSLQRNGKEELKNEIGTTNMPMTNVPKTDVGTKDMNKTDVGITDVGSTDNK